MQPEDSELHRLMTQNGVGYCGFPGDNRQLSSAYNYSSSRMLMMIQQQQQQSSFPLVHLTSVSGVLTNETTPEERALAALKNHKEAEKRRRERISSHLNKLRTILPSNSKLDKASLLAKVVERVKELKQQALQLSESESFPSETDEVTVLAMASSSFNDDDDMTDDVYSDGNGGGRGRRLTFKASFCCDDRSDLFPDIIDILKSLHLEMVKAEMVTLGGRIRNVLIVAAEKDHTVESVHFLQNALKSRLERSNSNSTGNDRSKRRRVLLDHRHHHHHHNLIIP